MMLRRNASQMRRGRRGYTLVEVAMVSALSAVLVLIALRWLSGIASVASSDVLASQAERLRAASHLVSEDLRASQHCGNTGLEPIVLSVGPTEIGVLSDGNHDGQVTATYWRIKDGYLERASIADQGGCEYPDPLPADWQRVLSRLDDRSSFTAVRNGAADTARDLDGACTGSEPTCSVDAIEINLIDADGGQRRVVATIAG